MAPDTALLVVVPARDEAELIGTCLAALTVARAAVAESVGARAHLVVSAARCTDATAAIARDLGAVVIESDLGTVGAARRAGVTAALALPGVDARTAWIACTDADSIVPPHWLVAQAAAATDRVAARAGTVVLGDGPAEARAAWAATYGAGGALRTWGGHGHVHGANLGVSVAAYLAVGGFEDVAVHEDVGLVRRLLASGADVRWPTDDPVVTSARTTGNVPGGLGDHLRSLGAATVEPVV